jgi:hypothetical protein
VGGRVHRRRRDDLRLRDALLLVGATRLLLEAGLRGFAALAGEKTGKELFPLMTLVAIPLAWDCARIGQATLIMTGFMLLAVVDAARSRWWLATLWLALSVAIKPPQSYSSC